MTIEPSSPPQGRYSCRECSEDVERIIGDRASESMRARYWMHIEGCSDCRRAHRLLSNVYGLAAGPMELPSREQDRQFAEILAHHRDARPRRWWQREQPLTWITGAALGAMATGLTLALFNVTPILSPDSIEVSAATEGDEAAWSEGTHVPLQPHDTNGGLEHPAQTYARILGGSALVTAADGEPQTKSTFGVGAHLQVGPEAPLQVGFVGKIVANFAPGSDAEWSLANPELVEVILEDGMVAVRYDRRESDPILRVRTPSTIVRVVGTVFTVEVLGADTRVSVLRGEVEILDPESNLVIAEVESGYRFDIGQGTFDDLGLHELEAALPLSDGTDGAESGELGEARIPLSWNVPGLPADPQYRTIANVSALVADDKLDADARPRAGLPSTFHHIVVRDDRVRDSAAPTAETDGEDLIEHLMAAVQETRRKELLAALDHCRDLYSSYESRYRAARCLSRFLAKYGHEQAANEAYLLLGMLRMDYALDYRAAEVAFQTFLKRSPAGASAEVAMYRLWLAATEEGRISVALERGRRYLTRYPSGRYVGKVLQRFPELKRAL